MTASPAQPSQTGGKKGAWRAGRLFTRLGSTTTTTINTKLPFADDKPGTGLAPRPEVCVSCYIRGPDASQPAQLPPVEPLFPRGRQKHNGSTGHCRHPSLRENELPTSSLSPKTCAWGAQLPHYCREV